MNGVVAQVERGSNSSSGWQEPWNREVGLAGLALLRIQAEVLELVKMSRISIVQVRRSTTARGALSVASERRIHLRAWRSHQTPVNLV